MRSGRSSHFCGLPPRCRRLSQARGGPGTRAADGGNRGTAVDADQFDNVLAGCARCHGREVRGAPRALCRGLGVRPNLPGRHAPRLRGGSACQRHHAATGGSGAVRPVGEACGPLRAATVGAESDRGSDPGSEFHGASIALAGVPAKGIPACDSCHGPPPRYTHYPRISGQNTGFIARQLMLFRSGSRGGTAYGNLMPVFAHRLSDQDIAAVATYYAQARQTP